MKNLLILLLFCLVLYIPTEAQLQSDQSDAVWSIVMPSTSCQDIDMGKVLLGKVKDSLITSFVRNTGTYKFRVDSLYFRGADATAFGLVSGFPKYDVIAGGKHQGEFRFKPARIGIHKAQIVLITQADTLIQNITGEGVEPQLQIVSNIIDFGVVNLGDQKDTFQVITIKNISSDPLTINEIKHNKPNIKDFTTLASCISIPIQTGESCKMDLRFKPSDVGRTSGVLEFYYNGTGSPAVVQLFGEGRFIGVVSAELKTDTIEAYPGDIIKIPIRLFKQENLELSQVTSLKTDFSFNSTLLWSLDFPEVKIDETTSKITIDNIPVNKPVGEVLKYVKFKVGLGNALGCDLKLSNGISVGGTANVTLQDGYLRLLGVCKQGGIRLVNGNSKAGLMKISPNPTDNNLSVEFSVTEHGYTEISIYNIMGEKVKTIFSESVEEYNTRKIDCEIPELGSGQYLIIFRTPTYNETMQLMILK